MKPEGLQQSPTRSQINPVYKLPICISKTHFNIIFPLAPATAVPSERCCSKYESLCTLTDTNTCRNVSTVQNVVSSVDTADSFIWWKSGRGVKPTAHLSLLPRLGTSGTIRLLRHLHASTSCTANILSSRILTSYNNWSPLVLSTFQPALDRMPTCVTAFGF
jgi:hypothetical protein